MRVCYIILTCEKFLQTRAKWQKDTFLNDVDAKDVYFISSKMGEPNIYGWNTEDNYEGCPKKYVRFLQNMNIDYDWYVFIDDDTYVNTYRLVELLQTYNSDEILYIGSKRFDQWNVNYMSGGAGFCLSSSLYKLVTEYVRERTDRQLYFNYNGDVTMGSWINKIPNVLHIDNVRFSAEHHKTDEQLTDFISFHYLKNSEQFEYYHKMAKQVDLTIPFPK
jgi:hypothetical protein